MPQPTTIYPLPTTIYPSPLLHGNPANPVNPVKNRLFVPLCSQFNSIGSQCNMSHNLMSALKPKKAADVK